MHTRTGTGVSNDITRILLECRNNLRRKISNESHHMLSYKSKKKEKGNVLEDERTTLKVIILSQPHHLFSCLNTFLVNNFTLTFDGLIAEH